MKKSDYILLFSIISLGCIILLSGKFTAKKGDTVIITKNGEIFGEYSLATYAKINIDDCNTVVIDKESAYMLDASCPDKLCINQGKTDNSSKKIICLPNKVTVEVTKKGESDKVVR